jgi:hypothetical protein
LPPAQLQFPPPVFVIIREIIVKQASSFSESVRCLFNFKTPPPSLRGTHPLTNPRLPRNQTVARILLTKIYKHLELYVGGR